MKSIIIRFFWVCCLFGLTACHQNNTQQVKINKSESSQQELLQLVQLMSGEFDSLKQSQLDESYYHISLKMKPIWTQRNDGHWLYVEQAVGTMLDKPYRQRIYHVTALGNNKFSSAVYEFSDPSAVVGGFENPKLLADIEPSDLTLRKGCAVILQKYGDENYSGSTGDKTCLSQLRGATYANSIVDITATSISSWDQGFDSNDQQVWGATAGPYVFDRKPDDLH